MLGFKDKKILISDEKEKEEKVIDFQIGTPEDAMWKEVADSYEAAVKNLEKQIIVNKAFLELAKSRCKPSNLTAGKKKS